MTEPSLGARLRASRRVVATLALSASVAAVGCDRGSAPTPAASVDQLGAGELVEGKETAGGFPLPDGMRITYRVGETVTAIGPASPEDVANYVRDRVTAKTIVGPNETTFVGAVVKDPRGPSKGPLRIVVRREPGHTALSVTPPLGSNYR